MRTAFGYDDFVALAWRVVPRELRARLDDPRWHNPKWHQYGLLEHVRRVIEAAERIYAETGIDIRLAAAFHDVGKIFLFEGEMCKGDAAIAVGTEPKLLYARHEPRSAGVARKRGADELTVWIVAHHDASYRPKVSEPDAFVAFCDGSSARAMHLMAICTVDAVGKGWTPAQREQRPVIAERFARVGEILRIDATFRAVADAAIRSW